MTRKEAEKQGYDYFYDREEPYCCCKADMDCSSCDFTNVCPECELGADK